MQNVLFQTDKPTSIQGRVEFYDLCITQERSNGEPLTLVQETHGWWDNDTNRAIIDEGAQSRCAVYKTFVEALEVYHRQRMIRARSGFMHSFVWHPLTGAPVHHSPVEIPRGSEVETPEESLKELAQRTPESSPAVRSSHRKKPGSLQPGKSKEARW